MLILGEMFAVNRAIADRNSGDFLPKAASLALRLAVSLGLVAAITFMAVRLVRVNATTVGFFYLVGILVIATGWGLLEAAVASVGAMLCFNFFFLPPFGTFTIADPQNWVALFAFLATSLTASQLSARLKRQKKEAEDRRLEMERLYILSRAILLTEPSQPAAKQIAHQIAHTFEFPVVALFDRTAGQVYLSGPQAQPEMLPELTAKLQESASQSTQYQEESGLTIAPIRLGGAPLGSLAICGAKLPDGALQSLVNLVAVGLEKVRAQEAVNRAEVTRQSEELKSTLLDAIAHEFKTPLTSIKAVTTDLLSEPGNGLPQQHRELIAIADTGVDHLERLVTEAIQLARIEGGKFRLNKEVHFPSSLISAAVRQMKSSTEGRQIQVLAGDSLPLLFVDAELVQLVIRNLIDNALKYSPPGSPIIIRADADNDRVTISVADRGPGIPEVEQQLIFDKFYRAARDRNHIKGAGMGLAIAREILLAHGGDIWVKSSTPGGSEFSFSLPIASREKAA
jgi:two-component system sensor histidine kinase KdpD